MKTSKFSLVFCTRENTDVFFKLDENIYGIHSKRINILYSVGTMCFTEPSKQSYESHQVKLCMHGQQRPRVTGQACRHARVM